MRIIAKAMLIIVLSLVVAARPAKAAIEEIFFIGANGQIYQWVSTAAQTGLSWTGSWVPLNGGAVTVSSLGETVTITGGTTAGGTALGTVGILGAALLIAVGATIAIDCAINGECIWTTVNNAGGWGVVLGYSPNPAAQPIPGAVTVNCSDPTPLLAQCKNSSIKNSITGYSSRFGGAFWTCGEIWANGATTGSADWMNALNNCNQQAAMCVASTMNVCQANNIQRADLQPVRVDVAVAAVSNASAARGGACVVTPAAR